jgi:dimethylamine monooxygenase subunit A
VPTEIPAEPPELAASRALRVADEWWPSAPKTSALQPSSFRHTVGVRAVDPATWLRPGPDDDPLRKWRCAVLDLTGQATFRVLPGHEQAQAAVLDLVTAAVGRGPGGQADARREGLELAGRMVVEDLCLVDVSGPAPVLVGASLVMPNRWRLADKIGRDLMAVHGPVPGYAQDVGAATDHLMRRLGGDRVMARSNWAITDQPDLFQPAASSRVERARPEVRTAADAAQGLFVRVEYQTVRAVPGVPAVLFTIRTAREPLGALADRPQVAASLAAVIEKSPEEHHRYKGLTPYLQPMLTCLRSMAG